MKRYIIMSFFAVALPLSAVAQDDMYFVPTKANVEKSAHDYGMPRDTYYSGSDRSVDEYNRRGSYVQEIDSAGNDVIDFDAVRGVYPDSVGEETATDYTYTRRMSRFDDYAWSDPYWEGYYAGRSSRWWWYDPWYYPGWYYDPWYYGWYGGPWHYGYYGWYGWHGHWWGGPHYAVVHRGGPTGTRNGVRGDRFGNSGRMGTARSVSSGIANRNRQAASTTRNSTFNTSERFGTSRTNTSVRSNMPARSTSSSSFSSGSFGGSRSTGSFGGGSRSGGSRGGGFGGRR